MQQNNLPPQERLMYLARCDSKYAKKLREQTDFVAIHKYGDCGYGFICDQLDKSEFGLLSSPTTITRFIEDPLYKGRVELREYLYGDGTELSQSQCDNIIHIWDYEKHGIIPLTSEYFNDGEREIGAVVSDFDIVRYIMRREKPQQTEQSPLKDTGNRSDLSGTGGLRDINPENGRCDLLPAHILAKYVIQSDMMNEMIKAGVRTNVGKALGKLLMYLDTVKPVHLYDALDSLIQQHYLTHADVCGDEEKNWQGVYKLRGLAQMMMDLSVHYKNGALKYAERNWEKGLPVHSFIDSAIRHLCKEILGWTDEPHLIACVWNIVGALYTVETYPHLLDLPNQKQKREENQNGNKVEEDGGKTENKSGNGAEIRPTEKDPKENISFKQACEEIGVKPFSEKKI